MSTNQDFTRLYTEHYEESAKLVRETGNTLISHLQRVRRIRYHSAALLLEKMEKEGVVSAEDAGGRRMVLPIDNRQCRVLGGQGRPSTWDRKI